MALLFLKSMFWPQDSRAKYSALPVHSRNHSTDSPVAHTMSPFNEKPSTGPSPPTRINPRLIADATIGLSDGLTVPFALTAGLSALGDSRVVIYGGLAELIAGAISMGLGGYLGARGEADAYAAALAETRDVVRHDPAKAARWVYEAFEGYEVGSELVDGLIGCLSGRQERMVDFLMNFKCRLAESDFVASRAYLSGLTISGGYFLGGLIPLLPYLVLESVEKAFVGSLIVMMIALFVFGWAKTAFIGEKDRWIRGKNGAQMVVLGSVAAGAAMLSVKALSG